jgi:WD40 repeat protein
VSIIDTRTFRATQLGSTNGQCVAYSPDGRILAVGCADGSIELWPLDSQGQMKPFVVKKHQGLVWNIAFSPDGRTMASGSADNNVVLWDVLTGEDLMTLKHNGTIEALRFSPDGRILATAAHEPSRGDVCLWRAPLDDEGTQNSPRPGSGPRFSDRPSGLDSSTGSRQAFPDATSAQSPAASYQQPERQPDRRPTDPSTPLPSGGSPELGDDRYGSAPMPAQGNGIGNGIAPSYGDANTNPSAPLGAGGGAAQPGGWQGSGGNQPRSGGRHARPTGQ